MSGKKMISLVIPCYNSEKTICDIVLDAISILNIHMEYSYEIILVNDGSKDNTWDMIKRCADEDGHVTGINLSKNFGQHNALIAAYKYVNGDIILGADDDGEHDMKDIFRLINKMESGGYDFVCASYTLQKKESRFRNIGTKINSLMAQILIDKPRDYEFTSFYCSKRFIIDQVIKCSNPYPYISGLVLQASRNLGTVELEPHPRKYGRSNYSLKKLLKLWLNGFTAFSIKPLRIADVMGVFIALFGFIYEAALIVRKILYPEIILVGYSSIMATLLFVGGILMLLLGIIGEYIGRIYININHLPQYVVKEEYHIPEKQKLKKCNVEANGDVGGRKKKESGY